MKSRFRYCHMTVLIALLSLVLFSCPNPAGTAPSTPTGFAVSGTPSSSVIVLAWTAVSGATGYRVYRSSTSGGTFNQLGSDIAAGTTSYTDSALAASTTFYYKVSAFNASGESAQSSEVPGMTASGGGSGGALLGGAWKSLTSGNMFSVAVKADGTLWAWGYNGYGEIGDGSFTNCKTPKQIGTDTDWAMAATGDEFTVAIKTDGSLWSWGDNTYGQQGRRTSGGQTNTPAQVGSDSDWEYIAAGGNHCVAFKTNGSLWTWGRDHTEQLGNGTGTTNVTAPAQIGTDTDWKWVSASNNNTFALKINNTLWAWGYNSAGQLGDGGMTNLVVPTQIGTGTWKWVYPSGWATVGIKTDGTLWSWGYQNSSTRLGRDTAIDGNNVVPGQIGTDTVWAMVSFSGTFAQVVKTTGALWAWGLAENGELGDGVNTTEAITPILIGSATDWAFVETGNHFAIAITTSGTVWGWGKNDAWGSACGQIGSSTELQRLAPGLISGL